MKLGISGHRKNKIRFLGGLIVLVVALLFRFLVPDSGQVVEDVEGYAQVIDGDSIKVDGREIRLQGIDAPEGRQTCTRAGKTWPCGRESSQLLKRLASGGKVFCKGLEIDRHDRILALCRAGKVDLNRQMVARGFAVSYGRFKAEEKRARSGKLGLWSGEFQRPRAWRREHNIGR